MRVKERLHHNGVARSNPNFRLQRGFSIKLRVEPDVSPGRGIVKLCVKQYLRLWPNIANEQSLTPAAVADDYIGFETFSAKKVQRGRERLCTGDPLGVVGGERDASTDIRAIELVSPDWDIKAASIALMRYGYDFDPFALS